METLSLDKQLAKKRIDLKNASQVRDFLKDKIYNVIGRNINSHNYLKSVDYKIIDTTIVRLGRGSSVGHGDITGMLSTDGLNYGNSIYFNNLTIKGFTTGTVKDFEQELETITGDDEQSVQKRKNITDIIEYMQENEVGEFDTDVHKVFTILRDSKGFEHNIEKAEEIVKLFKK